MCSLSSTFRYCCVGPAPFDDIGDIPYSHESRAEHKEDSRKGGAPMHASPRHGSPRHGSPRHASPRHPSPRHGSPRHVSPSSWSSPSTGLQHSSRQYRQLPAPNGKRPSAGVNSGGLRTISSCRSTEQPCDKDSLQCCVASAQFLAPMHNSTNVSANNSAHMTSPPNREWQEDCSTQHVHCAQMKRVTGRGLDALQHRHHQHDPTALGVEAKLTVLREASSDSDSVMPRHIHGLSLPGPLLHDCETILLCDGDSIPNADVSTQSACDPIFPSACKTSPSSARDTARPAHNTPQASVSDTKPASRSSPKPFGRDPARPCDEPSADSHGRKAEARVSHSVLIMNADASVCGAKLHQPLASGFGGQHHGSCLL